MEGVCMPHNECVYGNHAAGCDVRHWAFEEQYAQINPFAQGRMARRLAQAALISERNAQSGNPQRFMSADQARWYWSDRIAHGDFKERRRVKDKAPVRVIEEF